MRDVRIELDTAGLLPDAAVRPLLDMFAAQPMGARRLALLLRRIDAALVERGFITSRARLERIDPARSLVRIGLVPGRVEAIRSPATTPAAMSRVLPLAVGDLLTQEALEQGVQQINRLRMAQARVNVLPGQEAGGSLIDVVLPVTHAATLSLGADNLGTRATGSGRLRVGLRTANRLGLFEEFQLAHVRSAGSAAALASLSLPDGYRTWSFTMSGSHSDSTIAGFPFESSARTVVLGANQVLALNASRRDALDLSFLRTRVARTLGPVELATRRSTVARLAWSRVGRHDDSQYYVEPALVSGLRGFGADEDVELLPRGHTHYQFTKWSLALGLVARDAAGSLELASQFHLQGSATGLPSGEQIHLGGLASVRGFDEAAIAGDRGYLLRCELRFPSAFKRSEYGLTPFLHLDQGAAERVGDQRHVLAGAGAGLRGATADLVWEAVLSTPLRRPEDQRAAGWTFRFSIGYAI